jgi:L-fuconolactonase
MIIDSHVQFWKFNKKTTTWLSPEMKALRAHHLPEHISLAFKRNGIDGCIAVAPAASELETRFQVELAATHPVIKAIVGWMDGAASNYEESLDHFLQFPVIRGWKLDPLLPETVEKTIRRSRERYFVIELAVTANQLKESGTLLANYPWQSFVIEHCGQPGIRQNELSTWKPLIKEIAQLPHVYCKLSGLFTLAAWKEWSPGDFYPYLDAVFEAFGTDRLLFGSDWPYILLSGIYVQWKSLLEKYMENFPEEDRQKVFGENAIRLYQL